MQTEPALDRLRRAVLTRLGHPPHGHGRPSPDHWTVIRDLLADVGTSPDEQVANQRGSISEAQADAIERHVLRHADVGRAGAVLEVGCGTGLLTAASARSGAALTVGIDFVHALVARATRSGHPTNAVFVEADALSLCFPAQSFDRVIFNNAILYFPYEALVVALEEFRRVTKPGGTVFIGDICDPWKEAAHLYRWTGLRGRELLRQVGRRYAGFLIKRMRDGSRNGTNGWYTRREFKAILRDAGLTGRIVPQSREMPYHFWRYDCVVTVRS